MNRIIPVAKDLLTFNGAGALTLEDAARSPPHVLFVMGAHEARTALAAARLYAGWRRDIPVVISGGGNGRGSWFLQQALASICLLNGCPRPSAEEQSCEATLLERLLVDHGVPRRLIDLERTARHSAENWEKSLPIFLSLLRNVDDPEPVIGVVQSPLNRRRAQCTGAKILRESADPRLAKAQVKAIVFDRPDLDRLSERERVIELFRLFGLPKKPESELRVCKVYCENVYDAMPPELKTRAETAEREFHKLLYESPGYLDAVRGALETMAPELGGVTSGKT